MSQRQDRIDRIVAVEREYLAASVAADLLQARLGADPAFWPRMTCEAGTLGICGRIWKGRM